MDYNDAREKELEHFIIQKWSSWLNDLDPTPEILADLVPKGLLSGLQRLGLNENPKPDRKRNDFIEILKSSSVEQFKDFCQVMKKHNKANLLRGAPEWVWEDDTDASNAGGAASSQGAVAKPENQKPDSKSSFDKEISEMADRIRGKFKDNLVYLKGPSGLDYNETVRNHIIQYSLLTDDTREKLREQTIHRESLKTILDDMEKRPAVEWVLLAKIFIKTRQGHHLTEIGLGVEEIKKINEEECVKKCKQ